MIKSPLKLYSNSILNLQNSTVPAGLLYFSQSSPLAPHTCFLSSTFLSMKVVLRADSHGRDLAVRLREKGYTVDVIFKPNAKHQQVAYCRNLDDSDFVVIMAGTNNTWDITEELFNTVEIREILKSFDLTELKELSNRIIYVMIPKRFGPRGQLGTNDIINKINGKIFNILHRKPNIKFIKNEWFTEDHYRPDGVHFNDLGKDDLVEKLHEAIQSFI